MDSDPTGDVEQLIEIMGLIGTIFLTWRRYRQ